MLSAVALDTLMRFLVCRFMDVELQQRAVEYMSLEKKPDLARSNVVAMPPWEKRKSLLLRRMAEREVNMFTAPKPVVYLVILSICSMHAS